MFITIFFNIKHLLYLAHPFEMTKSQFHDAVAKTAADAPNSITGSKNYNNLKKNKQNTYSMKQKK